MKGVVRLEFRVLALEDLEPSFAEVLQLHTTVGSPGIGFIGIKMMRKNIKYCETWWNRIGPNIKQ